METKFIGPDAYLERNVPSTTRQTKDHSNRKDNTPDEGLQANVYP